MRQKKLACEADPATVVDPDDAPELTDEFFADAEVFRGDTFVRRGPGRPRTGNARELISVRLDVEVVAKLRAAGPGWQSQINPLLRAALQLDQKQRDAVSMTTPHVGRLRAQDGLHPAVVAVQGVRIVGSPSEWQNIHDGLQAEIEVETSKPASRPAKARTGKRHATEVHKR